MKKLAIIMILFSCAPVVAQEGGVPNDSLDVPWSFHGTPKILKFSPLEIFSAVPTFGADLEVKMTDNISLQGGAGAILPMFQPMSGQGTNNFDKMGGYKLRVESRFYIFKKPTRYFSSELSFRHLIIRDEIGVGMEPTTNVDEWGWETENYAYFINTPMVFHRFNTYVTFKYGIQKSWSNGFVLDMYTGLSIRNTTVRSWSDIPEGGTIPWTWNTPEWTLEDGFRRAYVTPIIGIKLGFGL